MDLFCFTGEEPTRPSKGVFINGARSKLWAERYDSSGEFEVRGPVGSDLKNQLPIGSLVSHINTDVPMIVENHVISPTDDGSEPEIVISGRDFETILEQRIIGADYLFFMAQAVQNSLLELTLSADWPWGHAKTLIEKCIRTDLLNDTENALPNVQVWIDPDLQDKLESFGYVSFNQSIKIPSAPLYGEISKILSSARIGFGSTWRPWTESGVTSYSMRLKIYTGVDKSKDVVFSFDFNDLLSSEYLWTNKTFKTAAMVVGRWVSTTYRLPGSKYNRRWMIVDGRDIDEQFESTPWSSDLTYVTQMMEARALSAILSQRGLALSRAEQDPESVRWRYREDYNLGDVVTVRGDYDQTLQMQVVEHVEIEDETGESSYPTFSPL